jgi:hypothetical protein
MSFLMRHRNSKKVTILMYSREIGVNSRPNARNVQPKSV